ncbi:MAG: hypothetical protein U1E65_10590 [Myxococcota bacterium]
MERKAFLLTALLTGCLEASPVPFEPLDAKTALFLAGPDARQQIIAAPIGGPLALLAEDLRAVALFHNTVAELGFDQELRIEDSGRAVPPSFSRRALDGTTDADAIFKALRLAPIDWAAVLNAGGCAQPSLDGPASIIAPMCPTSSVAPPAAPNLPALVPAAGCPAGWSQDEMSVRLAKGRSDQGPEIHVAYCEPATHPDLGSCAGDQMRLPDTANCLGIGKACAGAAWPSGLDPAHTLYVDPSAAPGGSGAIDSPLASIGEALARVSQTTTIALSGSVFAEDLSLPAGARLLGRCPGLTILSGDISVRGDAGLTNLSAVGAVNVRGGALSAIGVAFDRGLAIDASARASVRRSRVRGSTVSGSLELLRVQLAGTTVTAGTLRLSGVLADASTSLKVLPAGTLEASASMISGTITANEAQLSLSDSLLLGDSTSDACGEAAKVCAKHSALTIQRLRVIRPRDPLLSSATSLAIVELPPGTSASIEDLLIATPHKLALPDQSFEENDSGPAAILIDGYPDSAASIARAVIDGGAGFGIRTGQNADGPRVDIQDTHISAIDGSAVSLQQGRLSAERLLIAGCTRGLELLGTTVMTVADLRCFSSANPVQVLEGSRFSGQRLDLSAELGSELVVGRIKANPDVLVAPQVHVQDLHTQRREAGGVSIDASVISSYGSTLEIERFSILNRLGAGVWALGGETGQKLVLRQGHIEAARGVVWTADPNQEDEGRLLEGVKVVGNQPFWHAADAHP